MEIENIYQRNGYADRQEYLEFLADEYDVDIDTVIFIADMLGEEEDFDGLVSDLEDYTFIGLIGRNGKLLP